MYFATHFNANELRDDARYAVFDDIAGGFKFFPGYKGWLGCQSEFTVTDKYRPKRRFVWGKPSIMLMNTDPAADSDVDYEWLIGNCDIHYVASDEPLVEDVTDETSDTE